MGYLDPEDLSQQKISEQTQHAKSTKASVICEPRQVYPTVEMEREMELDNIFDYGKQIEIYEDSSFLVTDEGVLYSWGKNDNNILGREAKLEEKAMSVGDKRKKLTFSTFVPDRVKKVERYNIKKIKIIDGKFMAFFAEQQEEYFDEPMKDSEVDSEEEKDVVVDIKG